MGEILNAGMDLMSIYGSVHVLDVPQFGCLHGAMEGCVPGLEFTPECQYTGYQYSMEWYFSNLFQENPSLQADREDAEFFFLPHCVSQVVNTVRYPERYF